MAQVMLNQFGGHFGISVPDRLHDIRVFVRATLVPDRRRVGCQGKRAEQDQAFQDLSHDLVAQGFADQDVKLAGQPDLFPARPPSDRIVLPLYMRMQGLGRAVARLFALPDQLGH